MKIESTNMRDVYVITPQVHEDGRGFFMETFRADLLLKQGIDFKVMQANHSRSVKKNTVRGLHFQWQPPMAKIMRVTLGEAFLVAVDIRKGSPSLGKWFGIVSTAENKKQLYAPAGFARGFQTLTQNTEVQYLTTGTYNGSGEGEIAWNDPAIGIDWPLKEVPILSERSAKAPTLAQWLARKESDLFAF